MVRELNISPGNSRLESWNHSHSTGFKMPRLEDLWDIEQYFKDVHAPFDDQGTFHPARRYGVAQDMPLGLCIDIDSFTQQFASRIDELEEMSIGNHIWKPILGHQTLQLMRRPYGVKESMYFVTLPAFQRFLQDGLDTAERRFLSSGDGYKGGCLSECASVQDQYGLLVRLPLSMQEAVQS
ncbi:hypothetical protein CQW23_23569 [Capsicum baccatum]|uniref:Uncharacterized protein n=1 Tax=Capsicum baccatum TaxID=33114 RepID=A0A2G2VSA7_CAPBA|nr:hypothetical protein CQW23_23569 [Capsicum baccatum]